MVIEFVTSRCYKSHELTQASLLWGTVAQVSDVAHGPLVLHTIAQNAYFWYIKVLSGRLNNHELSTLLSTKRIRTQSYHRKWDAKALNFPNCLLLVRTFPDGTVSYCTSPGRSLCCTPWKENKCISGSIVVV